MENSSYKGLLVIGDPHLEGRQPGFRKDDYPNVILEKLEWSLDYSRSEGLLPLILGDLFDKPRDNPNWMLVRLMEILQGEILGIYGNHDVHYQPELTEHDSLSLLVRSGRIRLVGEDQIWTGRINGRAVVIGGSSYRVDLPKSFDASGHLDDDQGETPFVLWLTHHDILIPGYDEGRIRPREISGIDVMINGHIHRRLEPVQAGRTAWLTPGNISRRSRSDASKAHRPSVLRIDIDKKNWNSTYIEIPHQPYEEVFHEAVVQQVSEDQPSTFITGLAELQARRTQGGAGLREFLEKNLDQFDSRVADEIRKLAEKVTHD